MERVLISVEGINLSYCSEVAAAAAECLNSGRGVFGRKCRMFDFATGDETFFGTLARFCEEGGLGRQNNPLLQGLLYVSDYMESRRLITEAFASGYSVIVSPYVCWASAFHAGKEADFSRCEEIFYQLEMSALRMYSALKPSHSFLIRDDPDAVRHICYASGRVKSPWRVTSAHLDRAQSLMELRAEKGLPWITLDAYDEAGRRKLAITLAEELLQYVLGSGYCRVESKGLLAG